jgi:hypothetical protein
MFVIGKSIPLADILSSASVVSTSSTVSTVIDVARVACDVVVVARIFFTIKNELQMREWP